MELLRKGNVFSTYLITNALGKKIILKKINDEYLTDKEKYNKILKQFQIEKEILKLTDFDFMPRYISSKKNCLYMSYIKGKSLKEQKNKLNYKEKINILIKLCEIIKKLHNAKIIHCDIKPENIIYNGEKVFLIDFGAVTLENEEAIYIQVSKIYSAPEIYREYRRCPQNDIYSVASIYNQIIEEVEKDYRIIYGGMNKEKNKRFNSIDKILKILVEHRRGI